jgi:hypothetical protein
MEIKSSGRTSTTLARQFPPRHSSSHLLPKRTSVLRSGASDPCRGLWLERGENLIRSSRIDVFRVDMSSIIQVKCATSFTSMMALMLKPESVLAKNWLYQPLKISGLIPLFARPGISRRVNGFRSFPR